MLLLRALCLFFLFLYHYKIENHYQLHSLNLLKKLNTIWMSLNNQIVIPFSKSITHSQSYSDVKLSPLERLEDFEDKNVNTTSLNILGFSVSSSITPRPNSAFSLYNPNIQKQKNKNEQESQNSSSSEGVKQRQYKRTWKREKKDKRELSRLETKNLNRYFRSKINQMLRDIKQNPKDQKQLLKAEEVLQILNKSNKIMFSQIRQIIKDEWLKKKLLCCSGVLLKYIHGGKMGMQSKLIMLKYFNKIQKAIRNPDNFTCWK